jgi:hypothetical protein
MGSTLVLDAGAGVQEDADRRKGNQTGKEKQGTGEPSARRRAVYARWGAGLRRERALTTDATTTSLSTGF